MTNAETRVEGEQYAQQMQELMLHSLKNPSINVDVNKVLTAAAELHEGQGGIDLVVPYVEDLTSPVFSKKPGLVHRSFVMPHANPTIHEAIGVSSPFSIDRTSLPLRGVTFMSHRSEKGTVQFDVQPSDSEAVVSLQTHYNELVRYGGRLMVEFAFRLR